MTTKNKYKIRFKNPHTYAILIFIIAISCLLTYVIPSGEFDRKTINDREEVVSGTFHFVASEPSGFLEIFRSIPAGLISGADIIFYIFLVGGAFGIIHETGAITNGVNAAMHRLGKNGKLMIPLTMFIFSLLGFSIGLAEETIIFVPIGIAIARAVGYDAMTGAAMIIMGAAAGFLGGMLNPFTVGIAQKIAEIPLFSGWEFRTIIYICILIVGIIYVMMYGRKIKQDPTKSLVYDLEQEARHISKNEDEIGRFTKRQLICLVLLISAICFNVYGIFKFGWSFNEMSANFLLAGLFAGFIGGLGFNGTFDALIDGMKSILFGALIVGFAKGIVVVLENGKIIDTIVYYLTNTIQDLPASITVGTMFIIQMILNFFIPSGSGQAMTTMPLMVPISDILSINRQMAVLAFQYGDAVSNSIFPTSASLMGGLAVAGISYIQWVKFIWKLLLIWVVICLVGIFIALALGY
ncbi:YfcC family protein [Mammaliicoccus stepanovicii]|uniref:Short-chain fatty acids transporter n=1 Tax=Mammaliicoccus stepanovicii TaxID=643214 RepID=A0A239Z2H5_9STAP|nr:TIGR00366 family protein [Mammaliicoccus stepanovicii]PNZ78056.1 C4-dicarboxylate ABC transporter permease [Mammaliicoccus stepanovicii]GGI40249.1 C4-dicarboxylate ABC transporter [Mammaliicoccus stepanovicii]SNV65197.1 short-chain fatty acids transporter [Mammaliicoccus stepanovicii]